METIKFVTLTNDSYVYFTLNCIKSLEPYVGTIPILECYCIGKKSYDVMSKVTRSHRIDVNDGPITELQSHGKEYWIHMMKYKMDIIHTNLIGNDYVCYVDSDVVFRSDAFIQYCLDNIGNNDILVMNDDLNDAGSMLSTGFMFIKSNIMTRYIFDPQYVKAKYGWSLSQHLSQSYDQVIIDYLPINLYANGCVYYFNYGKMQPFLIHFNYITNSKKRQKMTEYGAWLLLK